MKLLQQTRSEALRSILTRAVILAYFSMLTVVTFVIVLASMVSTGNNIEISIIAGWAGSILLTVSGLVVFLLGVEFMAFLSMKKNEK